MHRSTFLPLQHAATLIFSVDWGLDVAAVHTAMSLIYIVVNIPNMLNVEDDEQTVAAFNSLYDSMERMLSAFESIDPQNLRLRFPSEI